MEMERKAEEEQLSKEHSMQEAMLDIKKKFSKNAIHKATSWEEDSTAIEHNKQVGVH